MRKVLSAVIAIVAAFASVSCEGQDPTPAPGTMTISVDKVQIESDGIDMATFTIKDPQGNVITTEANKALVFFKDVKTERAAATASQATSEQTEAEPEGGVEEAVECPSASADAAETDDDDVVE